jgi:hypothetical protein
MKYFLVKNLISLSISLAIVALLFMSTPASADQYIYSGPNGPLITDATLSPGTAPHVFASNAAFNAIGRIMSQSTVPEKVNLTVQNNTSTIVTLIPELTLGAGGITSTYTHTTNAPSASGSYEMKFVTGVDVAPVPVLTGVSVYSVCYNNNECDIVLSASLDRPARASGEHIDVSYGYTLCTTYGGCNPTQYGNTVSVDFAPGQQDIYLPSTTGQIGGEPQMQGHCVDANTTTVTVAVGTQCS